VDDKDKDKTNVHTTKLKNRKAYGLPDSDPACFYHGLWVLYYTFTASKVLMQYRSSNRDSCIMIAKQQNSSY